MISSGAVTGLQGRLTGAALLAEVKLLHKPDWQSTSSSSAYKHYRDDQSYPRTERINDPGQHAGRFNGTLDQRGTTLTLWAPSGRSELHQIQSNTDPAAEGLQKVAWNNENKTCQVFSLW